MRPVTAVILTTLLFAVVLGGLDVVGPDQTSEAAVGPAGDAELPKDDAEPPLVDIGDAQVWPYVAPDSSFDRRASSLNVVVRDDPASVRRYLAREHDWNTTDEEWAAETAEDAADSALLDTETVPWRDAPGATRYTYVADEGWVAERYQLHRGEYFGSRDHLRAFGPENGGSAEGGDWTAVQAHAEHWDWFTITHTVDSVEHAQHRVEAEFLGESEFTVRRVHHANGDTYDANGWTTVIALAVAPLLARRGVRRLASRRNQRRVALAGSLAALPLAVRFGGILFERHLPWLSPDLVVAVWYPVLVVGIPLAAYGLGRTLPAIEAGALAGAGIGLGIVLDYGVLGVAVLPIPVAAHRAGVVAAVALLAAGAGTTSESEMPGTSLLRVGAALWLAVVVAGHLV